MNYEVINMSSRRENAKKRLSNVFVKMDENHDGLVTMQDLKKKQEADGYKWTKNDEETFKKMDANNDGAISLDGNV